MKNILVNKFDVIRRRNSDSTVMYLVIGTLIIILLAVFSVWYSGDRDLFGEGEFEQAVETEDPNSVVVQQGEGLWQVAERICGDGELFDEVAEENGLSMWSALETGQELIVSCNY